ncbi:Holliday junction DNA helicase RuvA [Spiroplasma helicoides]|uniref:Holliday junction DNA helicase RuvA n=1 Tax=Spiroplasma helicoides TaxID=216938 RepID=A0A1B3SKS5_9MOLU|nr:hypothetical protein [Spiroplasma helicoides]AOG60548.1 Holliday junction DNA helicase RuvA [Spiroplasma helicoides]
MYYLNAKLVNVSSNEIIVESNDIGYKGFIVDSYDKTFNVDNNIKLYVLNYKNEYVDEYLFFQNLDVYKVANLLLSIKNFGIKSLLAIFSNIDYEKFINYVKNKEIIELVRVTGIGENKIKDIVTVISKNLLNEKYSKNQMVVISSLHKLGYKISSIYKVISLIDGKSDQESIFREAVIKLNEVEV